MRQTKKSRWPSAALLLAAAVTMSLLACLITLPLPVYADTSTLNPNTDGTNSELIYEGESATSDDWRVEVADPPDPNTGWKSPSSYANKDAGWTEDEASNSAYSSDDGYAAQASANDTGCDYLTFSCNVPTGATIDGIEVSLEGYYSGGFLDPAKFSAQLIKNGTEVGDEKVVASNYGTSDSTQYLGGATDLWGTTWTYSEVNATNFGVRVETDTASFLPRTMYLDHVQVKVYYTPPPEITTTSLPDGTVGAPYSQTLEATGGTTPYTWSRVSGSLPGGMSLSTGGVISGTPTAEGDFNFTVKVTDANLQEDTQALSIHVGVISLFNFSISASPDNLTLRQGENASSTISVSLISGTAETVSLSGAWMGAAPTGISYDFSPPSGTPTLGTPFTSTLTFTASSDAIGGTFIFEVTGSGGGLTRTDTITLMLPPAVPSLVSPENGMAIDTNTPTFDWNDVAGAVSYTLQVATDDNFSYPVFSTDAIESTAASPMSLSYGTRYYWRVRAKNDVGTGDWSSTWSFTAKLTAPKVLSFQIEAGSQYTNSTSVELTISARNAVEMSFSSDGVMWGEWEPYLTPKSYTLEAPDGSKNVYIRVKDNVGDISLTTLDSIILDQTPPNTSHSLSGELGADGYKGSVVITLTSMDVYSVESTKYKIDNGEWRTGHTFVISSDGEHTIKYHSTDAAGNEEEIKSLQVTVYTPTILPPILTQYWWAFLSIIVAAVVIAAFRLKSPSPKKRLKMVLEEKKETLRLKKEAAVKYFKNGSISRGIYDELMGKYDGRMAELEEKERTLRARVKKKPEKKVKKRKKKHGKATARLQSIKEKIGRV